MTRHSFAHWPGCVTVIAFLICFPGCAPRPGGATQPAVRGGPAAAAPEPMITKVYDVRDLLVLVPDLTAPDLSVPQRPEMIQAAIQPVTRASSPTTRPTALTSRPGKEQAMAGLIELIRRNVAPQTWTSPAVMRDLNGQLIVVATEENHHRLVELLADLRDSLSVQVIIEARFITVEEKFPKKMDEAWQKRLEFPAPARRDQPIPLTVEELGQLRRAVQTDEKSQVIAAPRLIVLNGQQACSLMGTQRAYVSDLVPAKVGTKETSYDPRISVAESGVMLEALATVGRDRGQITLRLHPRLSALQEMKDMPWPGKPEDKNLVVQKPVMKQSELHSTFTVSNEGAVLFTGLEDVGEIAMGEKDPAPAPATRPAGEPVPKRRVLLVVRTTVLPPTQPQTRQTTYP